MDVVGEFRTAAVRLHVLHHAAEGGMHGAWMTAELARHGHRIAPSTLYPLLHRMQPVGLLTSRTELVEGRHRGRYQATDHGRAVLAECRAALGGLTAELIPPDQPVQDQC